MDGFHSVGHALGDGATPLWSAAGLEGVCEGYFSYTVIVYLYYIINLKYRYFEDCMKLQCLNNSRKLISYLCCQRYLSIDVFSSIIDL